MPSGNGTVVPGAQLRASRPQVVVHVHARDADSFVKSESQVAAMVMRALSRGQKNL